MIVRGIDTSGDWLFGKGKNDYKKNIDAVSQNIGTRLLSFLGNCFFDTSAGIDWFNLLGAKNKLAIELAVIAVIRNTEGVTGVTKLSVKLDKLRKITLSYSVTTVYTVSSNTSGTINGFVSYILDENGNIMVTEDGDSISA